MTRKISKKEIRKQRRLQIIKENKALYNTNINLPEVSIYTDGSCTRNPGGIGGYAAIIINNSNSSKRKVIVEGYRQTTSNRMELMAAIFGLEALKKRCKVTVYTDSEYLANGINLNWAKNWSKKNWVLKQKIRPNHDLWKRLLTLCEYHVVWFNAIPRNSMPEQEKCDELAGIFTKTHSYDILPVDEEYENKI